MHEEPTNNVINFTEEAIRRLDSNTVSLEAKRHIIDILRRKQTVFGVSDSPENLPPTAVTLNEQNEIIYYALILKDPTIPKWDPAQNTSPPEGGWINISHPMVRAAQDLLQAYPEKMGATLPEKEIIDAVEKWWGKANTDERKRLVQMLLIDPNVQKWFSHDGQYKAPSAGAAMRLDNTAIFEYLPRDLQEYVTEVRQRWIENKRKTEQRSR